MDDILKLTAFHCLGGFKGRQGANKTQERPPDASMQENLLAAGALPRTPLGEEYSAPPDPVASGEGAGIRGSHARTDETVRQCRLCDPPEDGYLDAYS